MLIADAQVHIWSRNTPERPWRVGRRPHRPVPLGAEDLLREMDAAGVQRAVLVPPQLDADRNDLVLAAARKYPDRFAAMGRLDLEARGARERIATWRQEPGMYGLRCSFTQPHWTQAFADGRIEWLWTEAERAQVPIMALVTQDMLHWIDRIAERHGGLKLAICHLALPTDKRDEEAFRDFDKLFVLAGRPNVAVKASALPAYTSESYPFPGLHSHLRRVYDAFGPERIFWGTDFSRLSCPYGQAVSLFTEELSWLTGQDKTLIMGAALCRWLGWKLQQG